MDTADPEFQDLSVKKLPSLLRQGELSRQPHCHRVHKWATSLADGIASQGTTFARAAAQQGEVRRYISKQPH